MSQTKIAFNQTNGSGFETGAGSSGSAGAGNQYVEINAGGTTYKVLHDGTV